MSLSIISTTIIIIFGLVTQSQEQSQQLLSELNCEYAKNIVYPGTHIMGAKPLNKCIAFYHISGGNIESEMYFCENNALKVKVWSGSSDCNTAQNGINPSEYVDATADAFNCIGGECPNLQSSTIHWRETDDNITCPTVNGPNDLTANSYTVTNECFLWAAVGGSAIEICDSNTGIITYYKFDNTQCIDDGTKQQIYAVMGSQCLNQASIGSARICACHEKPICGDGNSVPSESTLKPTATPTTSPSRSPLREGETHPPTTRNPTRAPNTMTPTETPTTSGPTTEHLDQQLTPSKASTIITNCNFALLHFSWLYYLLT